jgi:RNA polymerase sigma-70 factor (ECF subfamily)
LDERELLQAAYRYALSLTHREADAEDLVQEAWLRLYQQYGGQMERARLFAAVRNLFVDQYRRHQLVAFEPYEEGQVGVDDVGDVVTAEDLEPALAALRPEEREAIFLSCVEGYTAREIAEFSGRPRGTVLSLINRGKRKMAAVLNKIWGDESEAAS